MSDEFGTSPPSQTLASSAASAVEGLSADQLGAWEMLQGQADPLFAILDAARDPKVLEVLRASQHEYQSLYEGSQGEELAPFAPYLVSLPQGSPLLEVLVREGWGKSWGVYLTSPKSFAEIRRHLRHFLVVKSEDGQQLYFRFYDPRVLRIYLPTCTEAERAEFFGSTLAFFTESKTSKDVEVFPRSLQHPTV